MFFIYFFVSLFIIGFIDLEIITPIVNLPEDICYYHTVEPPIWVEWFYLDSSGHTEFPYSWLHFSMILFLSLSLSGLLAKKTDTWFKTKGI